MEGYLGDQTLDNLSVSFADGNNSLYDNHSDEYADQQDSDLNKHPVVFVIYRIIVPIICGCGILGIILTGKDNNPLNYRNQWKCHEL